VAIIGTGHLSLEHGPDPELDRRVVDSDGTSLVLECDAEGQLTVATASPASGTRRRLGEASPAAGRVVLLPAAHADPPPGPCLHTLTPDKVHPELRSAATRRHGPCR
jgi:hypothetical protein